MYVLGNAPALALDDMFALGQFQPALHLALSNEPGRASSQTQEGSQVEVLNHQVCQKCGCNLRANQVSFQTPSLLQARTWKRYEPGATLL